MDRMLPRYPIYIPSKGRADCCYAAAFLTTERVPFFLVVEPQEEAAYRTRFPEASLLVLPFSNLGSVIPARNWIKEHSISIGAERHWQIDDNVRGMRRRSEKGRRIPMDSSPAFVCTEDFVDRYENVAIAGFQYQMFLPPSEKSKPFTLNCHVYSCCLVMNSIPFRWRGRYNEDTDLCLQVLSAGYCTVLINAFMIDKPRTMVVKGGNTDELYHGDGRLRMARSLERVWPGVVETKRRFGRPQHVVKDAWKKFDTRLRLKPGIDLSAIRPNEYGMKLVAVREPRSRQLKRVVEQEDTTDSGN